MSSQRIVFGSITYTVDSFKFIGTGQSIETAIVKIAIQSSKFQIRIHCHDGDWQLEAEAIAKIENSIAKVGPTFDDLDIRVYRKEIAYTICFAADRMARNATVWAVASPDFTKGQLANDGQCDITKAGVA